MGKITVARRQEKSKAEDQVEKHIQQACREYKDGKFSSIRKAAEAFGIHYSTLSRRLKGKSLKYTIKKKYTNNT